MIKLFWALRALIYKPFFGKFGLPSYIGKPLYLKNTKQIFIGKRVRIYPNARLEVLGKTAKICIEDNVSIGQNLHIIASDATPLVIGRDTTLSANVFITNTEHSYHNVDTHIMEQQLVNKPTTIGKNCFLGYGVVIQAGTILGKQCIVGANSVVRGNFSDYCVIVGTPARVVKRYDAEQQQWRKTNADGEFI